MHHSDFKIQIPVIKGVTYFLAHVPSLIRHGSKPSRVIAKDPSILNKFLSHLNTFDRAVSYPPNQVFIGNRDPDDLSRIEMPWHAHPSENAKRQGPFGEMMPEDEFYGIMKLCDEFDLFLFEAAFLRDVSEKLRVHPLIDDEDISRIEQKGNTLKAIQRAIDEMQRRVDERIKDAVDTLTHLPQLEKEILILNERLAVQEEKMIALAKTVEKLLSE